ncbi:hypothetical protein [Rhodopirellula bahusiensis]|uniref:Uncharacterized protein n=1 Tax=Rhodopirellula bahusiensis TaxID=2014065 RepID=A0A2G1WBH2_9BACT|nr:hypothetical protein [Rhodopirellula bahusiensis]PHQ36385.1 hypothetical protein CEE69_02990 [Rhodopirellula bahusiensis]
MSNAPHSPYTQPVPNSPSSGGSSKNTVIIVAIVSVTMLLMCGGVLGLGYYAVERLAKEINAVNYDYMIDDEETPEALMFALSENDTLREEVGVIESIEFAEEHNADNAIYAENYFYRVIGTDGEAVIRAELSEKEDVWFNRVDWIPDETDLYARVELETIPVPFDSTMAHSTYRLLKDNETIQDKVGTINYVGYEWEMTDEYTDAEAASYVFVVRGDAGETNVRVMFNDYDYVTVERIELMEDPENPVLLFGEPEVGLEMEKSEPSPINQDLAESEAEVADPDSSENTEAGE